MSVSRGNASLPIDLAHDGVDGGDDGDGVGLDVDDVSDGPRMCMRYGLAVPSETRWWGRHRRTSGGKPTPKADVKGRGDSEMTQWLAEGNAAKKALTNRAPARTTIAYGNTTWTTIACRSTPFLSQ